MSGNKEGGICMAIVYIVLFVALFLPYIVIPFLMWLETRI